MDAEAAASSVARRYSQRAMKNSTASECETYGGGLCVCGCECWKGRGRITARVGRLVGRHGGGFPQSSPISADSFPSEKDGEKRKNEKETRKDSKRKHSLGPVVIETL